MSAGWRQQSIQPLSFVQSWQSKRTVWNPAIYYMMEVSLLLWSVWYSEEKPLQRTGPYIAIGLRFAVWLDN